MRLQLTVTHISDRRFASRSSRSSTWITPSWDSLWPADITQIGGVEVGAHRTIEGFSSDDVTTISDVELVADRPQHDRRRIAYLQREGHRQAPTRKARDNARNRRRLDGKQRNDAKSTTLPLPYLFRSPRDIAHRLQHRLHFRIEAFASRASGSAPSNLLKSSISAFSGSC